MNKYRVDHYWQESIARVVIQKETDVSIWTSTGREAKQSQYRAYFDTFQEAKDFLVSKALQKVESCKLRLSNAETGLQKALSFKEPTHE